MLATPLNTAPDWFAGLRRSVDGLTGEELSRHGEQTLGEDLIALNEQINRMQAEFCRRLTRFDSQRAGAAWGASSTVSWLRHHCRMSSPTANSTVQVSRLIGALPAADEAFADGAISLQHASVLSRSVSALGAEVVQEAEATLVEAARCLTPGDLRVVTEHLRAVVDPDGADAAYVAQHERRYFTVSQTLDGVFAIDGQLDPVDGAMLDRAIRALMAPPAHGDPRTAGQRRADALIEMVSRVLGGGELPVSHGVRPHLTLTVSTEGLAGVAGSHPGELIGVGPVPRRVVQRLACDASVTALGVDANGNATSAARATRTISPAMRRAMLIRDGGCRFPGCDRPPDWTEGHHTVHWAHEGPTTLANLVSLCRWHHHYAHDQDLRVAIDVDGNVQVSRTADP